MDRQTVEWRDTEMDGQRDRWMDRETVAQTEGRLDAERGRIHGWTEGGMDKQITIDR